MRRMAGQCINMLARLPNSWKLAPGCRTAISEYVNAEGSQKYEIEHIWANHYVQHMDEYDDAGNWQRDRNRIGGLLLVRRSSTPHMAISPTR